MTDSRPNSAELRATIIDTWVWPLVRAAFEAEPRVESVLFLVGQFWADEAHDAVHGEFLACVDRDPEWPDCADFRRNPIGELGDEGDDDYDHHITDDEEFIDDAFRAQEPLWHEARYRAAADSPKEVPDSNGEMIVAFASFCDEGSTQEDPYTVAFTPYCIFRRGSDDVEIVGTMRRPAWEDRWDVIDDDGPMPDRDVDAPSAAPAPAWNAPLLLALAALVGAALAFLFSR